MARFLAGWLGALAALAPALAASLVVRGLAVLVDGVLRGFVSHAPRYHTNGCTVALGFYSTCGCAELHLNVSMVEATDEGCDRRARVAIKMKARALRLECKAKWADDWATHR